MATFSNCFRVFAYGDVVRIVFEDAITGKEGVIQTQVVMRTTDAEQLSTVIADTIKKHRAGQS
jgi:hypothetical protein